MRFATMASATTGILCAANLQFANAQVILNPPTTIPAQCVVSNGGANAVCEGDLSAGLDADGVNFAGVGTLTNLTVQNTTSTIGGAGVDFDAVDEDLVLIVDTTPNGINSTGDGISSTILAPIGGFTAPRSLTIQAAGDIISALNGITGEVQGSGTLTIVSQSNIQSGGNGIAGITGANGAINITSNGTIDVNGATFATLSGILADNLSVGSIDITANANISVTNAGSMVFPGVIVGLATAIQGPLFTAGGVNNVTVTSNAPMLFAAAPTAARGINVGVDDGDILIMSSSDINLTSPGLEIGIDAFSTVSGNIGIQSSGAINVADIGIQAVANAGNVDITSDGAITVNNTNAIGVSGSTTVSGNVSITSNQTVSASGTNAIGILGAANGTGNATVTTTSIVDAQAGGSGIQVSVQPAGIGTVNVNGTNVLGGSVAAVNFAGPAGSTNILNTSGTVTLSATSGTAVNGGAGNTTLNNTGILNTLTNGAIELGTGNNAFNNLSGATFNSGAVVNLGTGNFFTNSGTFAPGGNGAIQTTTITGNLTQTSTGIFAPTVDLAAQTGDLVVVTGTAGLAGFVQPDFINITPGLQQQLILTAAGGVTNNALGLIASPVLQAELLFPNPNDVVLQTNLDFTAPTAGLNPNQTNVANIVGAAFGAGGGGLQPIIDALINGVSSAEELAFAYDQLGAESFLNLQSTSLFASLGFANNLLSCREVEGVFATVSEDHCAWFQPQGRFLNRDATPTNIGFDEQAGGFATGAQVSIAPYWSVGFGFGYETGSFDTTSGVDGNFDRLQGGLVVLYERDRLLLSGSISGGSSENDVTRAVTFGGLSLFPRSEPDVGFVTFQSRFAYLFETSVVNLKPQLDLSLTRLDLDGVTETGGGAANLTTSGERDLFFSASPSLEVSMDYDLDDGFKLRTFADLGFTVFSDTSHSQTASFVAAPAGVGAFAVSTELDRFFGEVDAGATLISDEGHSITLRYQGRFSDDTSIHGGQLRASFRF